MSKADELRNDMKGVSASELEADLRERVNAERDEEQTVFHFPAGYYDAESKTVIREFEVREMTGADEESMQTNKRTPNAGRNLNKLLERCIVRIGTITPKSAGSDNWRNIIRGLCVPDQDYATLMIRKLSFGDELTVGHHCPECGNKIKTIYSVDELEVIPYTGDQSLTELFELPKGITDSKGVVHRTGVMRLPNGNDREILVPVAQANLAKGRTLMLTRLLKFDGGYVVSDSDIRNMSMRDRRYLTELNAEMVQFGVQTKGHVVCPDCENEFEGSFDSMDFQ